MTKEKDPTEVVLKNVRLSFADLFKPGKPQKNDAGEEVPGKYKANFLLEKGTDSTKANLKKLKAAALAAKEKKWGENPDKHPKLKPEKICLRDGDLEDWDGYADCMYLSANNADKPGIYNRNRKPVESQNDSQAPYSGCYVNAVVRLWAMDNDNGKRLNASVEAVQFFKDGEAFSGRKPVDPNDAFEDFGDDEDGMVDMDDDGDDDGGSDLL